MQQGIRNLIALNQMEFLIIPDHQNWDNWFEHWCSIFVLRVGLFILKCSINENSRRPSILFPKVTSLLSYFIMKFLFWSFLPIFLILQHYFVDNIQFWWSSHNICMVICMTKQLEVEIDEIIPLLKVLNTILINEIMMTRYCIYIGRLSCIDFSELVWSLD